jgi:carbon monoxide dehydrogenase subunit G
MAMPRVEGSERLALDRARVWGLLNDPDTLGASIPGCRGFERDSDAAHRYRTAIKVAVGAVTGVYEGTVEYRDVSEPERCTIVVSGKGDKGTIEGKGAITLAAVDGETEVGYHGDFKLTGPIAGVGQRLAPGISRKVIVETLRNLERRGEAPATGEPEVTSQRSAQAAGPSAGAAVTPSAAAPAAADDDAFRLLRLTPGVAFAAGAATGFAIATVIFAGLRISTLRDSFLTGEKNGIEWAAPAHGGRLRRTPKP